MKKVRVKDLCGGEVLAKDLYVQNYGSVLVPKGTILKQDYIDRLEPLGFDTVYIEEDRKENAITELMEECQNQVKQVMERHIYKHNEELKKLCSIAEDMIMEVVNEEPLNEKIVEIQEEGTDVYSHSMQVCTLSTMLALKCGLERELVQDTLKGALLHDIGLRYITVPYESVEINDLPKSSIEEYKNHTTAGYQALEREKWITSDTKDIIFYHHERMDGSGYPLKLSGDRLSLPVKIVSVCDAFDERLRGIGHKRCKLQEAVEFLRDNKGVLFDKTVTETFLKMIVQYPTGCMLKLSTGEVGKVVSQNKEMPERPVVSLLYAQNGEAYKEPKEMDLMKVLNVIIVEILEEKDN